MAEALQPNAAASSFPVSEIADLAPDSIVVSNWDGEVTYWNPASASLYGWAAGQALGQDLNGLLASHHAFAMSGLRNILAERDKWKGELLRTTADGREIRVEVQWTLRRDRNGLPVDIVEYGRDVSALSEMEVENRLAEHRYRNIFHAMAASFWELDFSQVRRMVEDLINAGIIDIPGHFAQPNGFIRKAMAATRILDVNEKTAQIFGAQSREQMIGMDVSPFWPPESEHVYANALLAAARRLDSYVTETRLNTLDGRKVDALFTVCWPEDHKGRGSVLVGVIDITDMRRAFAALEISEQRYKALFHHMPIPLVQLDMSRLFARLKELAAQGVDLPQLVATDDDFLAEVLQLVSAEEANAEAVSLLGAPSEQDLLIPIAHAWKESAQTIRRSLLARLRGEQRYSEETRINTQDGRVVDVLYTIAFSPELLERGINVVGFIDIGDRKRAHAELERSEARYRDLFHHMPISLWQLDGRGSMELFGELREKGVEDVSAYFEAHPEFLDRALRLVEVAEVNQHTVQLFGGQRPADFLGPVDRFWENSRGTFRRSLEARFNGGVGFEEETQLHTLDGRVLDVLFSIAFPPPLVEQGMSLVGILDISDRVRAEEQLARVQADFAHAARVSTLGELTASIAHEVNQPLAAITTNGEASLRWLSRKEPDLEEVSLLATRMVADARRASDIIKRIRGMAMKRAPEFGPVDINEMIQEALLFVRHEMQGRNVDLHLDLARGLPTVRGDRIQLQQVLVNLAVNALQAMAEHEGPIHLLSVSSRTGEGGTVALLVADTGPGIDPAHVDQLFTGFFTTKSFGMGMGLPICRSIIEAHGGAISIMNRDGGGAAFTVTLPTA